MIHYFVSDLHLSHGDSEQHRHFQELCARVRAESACLYILGDLVDAWIGDDAGLMDYEPVVDALRRLVDAGISVALIAGNHDFLFGETFRAVTGALLLPDPWTISVQGRRILLSHGDLLCAQDIGYQQLRTQLRSPTWQSDFVALPLPERQAYEAQLRLASSAAVAQKRATELDVSEEVVRAWLTEARCDLLIHGHTHLPGQHNYRLAGRACTRVVLGSWRDAAQILRLTPAGHELAPVGQFLSVVS